jgi:AcrR family transcriptional regulator
LPQTENWFKIQRMRNNNGAASRHLSARSGYAKSLTTRARILAATLEEASNAGLHKASVVRIAARAGVAVGNLNYHFGSRGKLLRQLMGSLMADLLPRLHAADADDHADFFERERAGLLVYLDYLRAHPAHVRLASEIRLHDPTLYRRAVAAWVERIAARIRAGIAHGALKPMDATQVSLLAHFLLGASQFLDHMMETATRRAYPGDTAVVDAYIALLRTGLARKPGTVPTRRLADVPRNSKTNPGGGRRKPKSRPRRGKGQ